MTYTRGIRNNNPFNIVRSDNNWLGKIKSSDTRFEQFINIRYGLRAGLILLRNYISLHNLHDVTSIISRFAPPSENKTDQYIAFVERFLERHQCDTGYITTDSHTFFYLASAILRYESNYICSTGYLQDIYKHYNL